MLDVGATIDGRFVLEAELGRGGMGVVFRAHDQRLHRRVALKIIRQDPATSGTEWAEAKARLLREARAAAAFDHPNAVHVHDLGEVDGMPFIAMEFVPGTDLRRFVGDASVPWARKLRWLVDVAEALGAAHEAGLVHRDIKPENVMLRENGRIKVLDFGIARRASAHVDAMGPTQADGAIATLTGTGRIVGTPQYMAPEQIRGEPLDGRADQYAWGVMAYELLGGTLPWSAPDLLALMAAALTAPPPPLAAIAPDLPLPLVEAIHRTLEKDPAARFASMAELVQAIETYALPAQPASLPPGPARASGAPASSSGAPGAIGAMVNTTEPQLAAPPAPAPPSRRLARPALLTAFALPLAVGATLVALKTRRPPPPSIVETPALSSAVAPIPVTALPAPKSTSAAALAAYAAGLKADRDGADTAARQKYAEALAADPALAEASLRLALLLTPVSTVTAREHLHKARAGVAALAPRERAMVDALGAVLTRELPDYEGMRRTLAAAVELRPADAELWQLLAVAQFYLGRFDDARAAVAKALDLDPTYGAAWMVKGDIESYGGTRDGAIAAYRRCEEVAAGGPTHCRRRLLWVQGGDGRCADAEATARRAVAADPTGADGYDLLGMAAVGVGRPREAIREIFVQAWSHQTERDGTTNRDLDEGSVDVLTGDFAGADRHFRDNERQTATSADGLDHAISAWARAGLLVEEGDLARAATVADEYLRRKDAWTAVYGLSDFSVYVDYEPLMLETLKSAGRISAADFRKRLGVWAEAWGARLPRAFLGYVWLYGYARTADTQEDAEQALSQLPKYEPLPWFRPSGMGDALVGRTHLLAGHVDAARPVLEYGAKSCMAFDDPFAFVRTFAWLGAAREQTGDKAGACEAYGEVLRRWGKTKSVTARASRARVVALGCKP